MQTKRHMRCLGCGYILDGLTENRCPECGREFDPNDAATFTVEAISGVQTLRWALVGAAGPCAVAAVTMFVPTPGSIPGLLEVLVVTVLIGWLIAGSCLSYCLWAWRRPEIENRSAFIIATIMNVLVVGSLLATLCATIAALILDLAGLM